LDDAQVVLHVQVGGVGAAVVAGVGVVGPCHGGRVRQRAGGCRGDGGGDRVGDRDAGGDEADGVVDEAVAADVMTHDPAGGDAGRGVVGHVHVGGGAGFVVVVLRRAPRSALVPYATLFRSLDDAQVVLHVQGRGVGAAVGGAVGVVRPSHGGRVGQRAGGVR